MISQVRKNVATSVATVSLSINLSAGWQRLKKEGGFVSNASVGVLSTVGGVWDKSKKIWREFDVPAIFILFYWYIFLNFLTEQNGTFLKI